MGRANLDWGGRDTPVDAQRDADEKGQDGAYACR